MDRITPGTILRLGGMTDCFQPAIEYRKPITGFEKMTVREDVTEHYLYWRECFNPADCCNLQL